MSGKNLILPIYLENDVVSDPPAYRPRIDDIDHAKSVPEITGFSLPMWRPGGLV